MHAMVIEKHGDVSVFQKRDIPRPEIKPNHVLIKVYASSVNPIDTKLRKSALPFSHPLPAVLHGDVAGVVESVGPGVRKLREGDEVYACAGGVIGVAGGALADYMLADADLVSLKPKTLSFTAAAALPLVSITAWEALVDKLDVKLGQNLLVHGATGGVGHIAVQLGKCLGARVHTTAGSEPQLALARELGADVAINYRTESVDSYVKSYTEGRGFDVIFDTVGGPNLQNSFQAIAPHGSIACIAMAGEYDLSTLYVKGASLHAVLMLLPMMSGRGRPHHGEILASIARLVDERKIKPLIDPQQFAFAEVGKAHAYLESGKATGKVVLYHDDRTAAS